MAKEYASAGITVNAHCPGVVGTDMWVTIDERFSEVTGAPKGQTYQQFVDGIAFGRAQTPADVAAFVPYLAGPDSDYMTGQAGLIDGSLVYRGPPKTCDRRTGQPEPTGCAEITTRPMFGRDVPPSAAHQPPSHPAIRRLT